MLTVHDNTAGLNGYFVTQTNSTAIASFHFRFTVDPDTDEILDKEYGELAVSFIGNNETYYYRDVRVTTFFGMVNSSSVGAFFNSRIKGHYDFEAL